MRGYWYPQANCSWCLNVRKRKIYPYEMMGYENDPMYTSDSYYGYITPVLASKIKWEEIADKTKLSMSFLEQFQVFDYEYHVDVARYIAERMIAPAENRKHYTDVINFVLWQAINDKHAAVDDTEVLKKLIPDEYAKSLANWGEPRDDYYE